MESKEISGKEVGILRLTSQPNKTLWLRTDFQFGGKKTSTQKYKAP